MKKEIRFGIVGCGIIAPTHAEAILQNEGAVLAGACSKTFASTERFCKEYPCKAYESYDQMLLDPAIDAVAICTPSGGHFEECKKALQAGKHVVVEKPMCMTELEAQELVRLADASDRMLCSIVQARFSPAAQIVHKAIQNGEFGKLITCGLTMRYNRDMAYFGKAAWRGTIAADGGMLLNQGLHGIDLLCWLMGTPKKVSAFSRTLLRDVEIEDTVAACLEFENGALATVDATLCSIPEFDRKISICGEKGTVILEKDEIAFWSLPTPQPVPSEEEQKRWNELQKLPYGAGVHTLQYENIMKHLLEGAPLEVDARQGKLPLSVIFGIYESSKQEKTLAIRL